jgi:hypothetical protein
MIDPLLQERIDDFKKDIIEVCKRHRMWMTPHTVYRGTSCAGCQLVIIPHPYTTAIEEAEWSEWTK